MISDETLLNYKHGVSDGTMLAGAMPRVILELIAEVERLRAELALAVALVLKPERLYYGWNAAAEEYSYFIDGTPFGETPEEAIAAKAVGGQHVDQ